MPFKHTPRNNTYKKIFALLDARTFAGLPKSQSDNDCNNDDNDDDDYDKTRAKT